MAPCVVALLLVLHQAPSQPLVEAVKKGDLATATALLNNGANPNAREVLLTPPSLAKNDPGGKKFPGETPLALAIGRHSLPLVKLLLAKGADVNQRGYHGYTALNSAVDDGNVSIVEYLLDHGAKTEIQNDYGDTPIVFAANRGNIEIIDLLLRKGANIDGGSGWSPLMEAAYGGDAKVVRFLLKRHANPNYHSKGYMTPLECARSNGADEAAELIRKAGGKGRTAAQLEAASKAEASVAEKAEKARKEQKPQTRELTVDDSQVIEAVLLDIVDSDELLGSKRKDATIFLIDQSAGEFNAYGDDALTRNANERASEVSLGMRKSLRERNSGKAILDGFRPFSQRIVVGPESKSPERPYDNSSKVRAWVWTYLPGYSPDGKNAVLLFGFGPTPHGASGAYLLAKEGGVWRVKWRKFAFYA